MTTIRDKPIYLSNDVYRALWILAKTEIQAKREWEGASDSTTPDQIANGIISSYLQAKHPAILEHLNAVDQMQKKLIAQLRLDAMKEKPQ